MSRDDEFIIDYGSHTEFFIVKDVVNPEDVIGDEMED